MEDRSKEGLLNDIPTSLVMVEILIPPNAVS